MTHAGRRRIAVAVAAALTALTAAGASTVTPAEASPVTAPAVPGPQTAGDKLFPEIGNGGYNVRHYKILLTYATSGSIRATTTIKATASKRLSSFSLDLEGLAVERVVVDGRTAAYSHLGAKLVVTPRTPVAGRFTVVVRYAGTPKPHTDPDDALDGWIPTSDGATVLSEPVGAMTWFPNNNTPRDKATFTIAVNVPKHLEVAGSGDLAGRQRHGARTTWVWRQSQPMATYLAMISIGNYDVYHSTMKTRSGRTLPIWSFIEPSLGSLSSQRAMIPGIIRFGERHFGRYPFGSTGIVVKNLPVDYSLETQNRPVFDATADALPDTALLVHELAHQWYGDSVTPKDWSDIWLNEGFATYAEWWWAATHGGPSTAQSFQNLYDTNPDTAELWSPAPAGFTDPADLFGDPVYDRGAMTLEVLRQRVGAADFAVIMRRWATQHRGDSVSTGQFIRLAERVSKQDLEDLFHDWLYVAARPVRG